MSTVQNFEVVVGLFLIIAKAETSEEKIPVGNARLGLESTHNAEVSGRDFDTLVVSFFFRRGLVFTTVNESVYLMKHNWNRCNYEIL